MPSVIYAHCPLAETEVQQYCSLVENYKQDRSFGKCPYANECHEMKNCLLDEAGKLKMNVAQRTSGENYTSPLTNHQKKL